MYLLVRFHVNVSCSENLTVLYFLYKKVNELLDLSALTFVENSVAAVLICRKPPFSLLRGTSFFLTHTTHCSGVRGGFVLCNVGHRATRPLGWALGGNCICDCKSRSDYVPS